MTYSTTRRVFIRSAAASAAALAGARAPAPAAPEAPGPTLFSTTAGDPVFLLEGSTVASSSGVRARVCPLTKSSRNPLLVKDAGGEGEGPRLCGSVVYDPDDRLFKCWYIVSSLACLATSADGYLWNKRTLRVGERPVGSIGVVAVPPDSGVRTRYLAAYLDGAGVCLAYSDDGAEWTQHKLNPIFRAQSGTRISTVYQATLRRWLIYHCPALPAGASPRAIGLSESQDLQSWSSPEVVLEPDAGDPFEFFGMPVFQRGNLSFGLLHVFGGSAGRVEVELVFSSGGRSWQRLPPREQFLACGAPGDFDAGMVLAASAPVIVREDMRFYYAGSKPALNSPAPGAAEYSIGMASVPKDRFFGTTVTSQDSPGVILTRPLLLNGSELAINANVQGQLKVAVLDVGGRELPGFELDACRRIRVTRAINEVDQAVSWGRKALPRERPVRLKFQLDRSTLYAFYVR